MLVTILEFPHQVPTKKIVTWTLKPSLFRIMPNDVSSIWETIADMWKRDLDTQFPESSTHPVYRSM